MPYTKEYLENNINSKVVRDNRAAINRNKSAEFEIICISDCENIFKVDYSNFKCKKGDRFKTNKYDFNYSHQFAPHVQSGKKIRLIVNGMVVGFFLQSNFRKLSDYRNDKIEELFK